MNKNTQGPWEIVIDGTCSAAWPHIVPLGTSLDDVNEECIAELSSVYLERSTDGIPGSWAEKPERFDKSPDHDEIMRKARLIAASPDLLSSLSKKVNEAEQAFFEEWMGSNLPSGDHEEVQRKWLNSSDYNDFFVEWGEQIEALSKATGEYK